MLCSNSFYYILALLEILKTSSKLLETLRILSATYQTQNFKLAMDKNSWKLIDFITAIILFSLFCVNSWLIFSQFVGRKMVSSSTIVRAEKQTMPAIIICRENAFTDVNRDMLTLNDFINNTFDLVYDLYHDKDSEPIAYNSTNIRREYIYSFTRGYCYVLKFISKVTLVIENYAIIYIVINIHKNCILDVSRNLRITVVFKICISGCTV